MKSQGKNKQSSNFTEVILSMNCQQVVDHIE